eukprot:16132739-Heterocapsa_arctica.AAC.1
MHVDRWKWLGQPWSSLGGRQEKGLDKWIVDGVQVDLRVTSPKLFEQMAIEAATANVWRKASSGPTARRDLKGIGGP